MTAPRVQTALVVDVTVHLNDRSWLGRELIEQYGGRDPISQRACVRAHAACATERVLELMRQAGVIA